jgi:hypothetical protein
LRQGDTKVVIASLLKLREARVLSGEFQIGTKGVYPPVFCKECASCLVLMGYRQGVLKSVQAIENVGVAGGPGSKRGTESRSFTMIAQEW